MRVETTPETSCTRTVSQVMDSDQCDTGMIYPVDSGGSFRGVKRPGREDDHSLPSSAEVECVKLYLHSPNMLSWHRNFTSWLLILSFGYLLILLLKEFVQHHNLDCCAYLHLASPLSWPWHTHLTFWQVVLQASLRSECRTLSYVNCFSALRSRIALPISVSHKFLFPRFSLKTRLYYTLKYRNTFRVFPGPSSHSIGCFSSAVTVLHFTIIAWLSIK